MIKATLTQSKSSGKDFPKLMITETDKVVVLFNSDRYGVVLDGGIGEYKYPVGYISSVWDMSHFIDYNEIVTLQNQ